jgi:pyruvate,orthophosphate dikinase
VEPRTVPDAPSARNAAEVAALALRDAILFQLALRAPALQDQLLAACGCGEAELLRELATLESAGLVARQQLNGRELISVGVAGRERAAAVVQSEAALLRPEVAALDGEFGSLNRRVKEILLRWQVRVDRTTEVPNDHTDARYDAHVLSDLRAAHAAADRLLARLEPLRARYASLRGRLRDAIARAGAGERAAVAGVTGDSFHTAWWELHGDLLAILGRARTADD